MDKIILKKVLIIFTPINQINKFKNKFKRFFTRLYLIIIKLNKKHL